MEKNLITLEYHKILGILANYAYFEVSREKILALRPETDYAKVRILLDQTEEARTLLRINPGISLSGSRDIRKPVRDSILGGVIEPHQFLDIKSTLVASRSIERSFNRTDTPFPLLNEIISLFPPSTGLVDAISKTISDHGEILDSASAALSQLRKQVVIAHDRVQKRFQRILKNPDTSQLLQENIITQRDGRYVIPLKSDFKGRLQGIIHDQSTSGATLFIEPLELVEMNNTWRELQFSVRDEERRVLAELCNRVREKASEILQIVNSLGEFDLVLCKAKYADDLTGVKPDILEIPDNPEPDHPRSVIRLWGARHPLLDPKTVIPIDMVFDPKTFCLVITGPNTGGKTITLKTVGLLTLMAQSGIHIPVQPGSAMSIFKKIYADIGDEQSIEQSLSTFSAHISNIISILEKADSKCLVLLDELGSGTDPQEGAALARSILSDLVERRITTLVASHYPELKIFAHNTSGVSNASVEFDIQTLRPTYRLVIGLPGRSNALAIAQRLGLPEGIVQMAEQEINPHDLKSDDLLDEIFLQRDLARESRADADKIRATVSKLQDELRFRLENIERERYQVLEETRQEAAVELDGVKNEVKEIRKHLARTMQPLEPLMELDEVINELEEIIEQPIDRVSLSRDPSRPIGPGSKVHLPALNSKGTVTSIDEDTAEVLVGNMRVRVRLADISQPLGTQEQENLPSTKLKTARLSTQSESTPDPNRSQRAAPDIQLDLRGERADAALEKLDRYLDAAYLSGIPWVRIIHGKGTGRLREVIRNVLNSHPEISRYAPGVDGEGGDGVTVAWLKST